MAKAKEEPTVSAEPTTATEVPMSVAVIAGSIAATISVNGVMKGAHDNMIALQAIRIHEALKRIGALCQQDPEMVLEPVTDVAIGRMYDTIKAENARIKAEAEEQERKRKEDDEAAAKKAAEDAKKTSEQK